MPEGFMITADAENLHTESDSNPPTMCAVSKLVHTLANAFGLYEEYVVTSHIEIPDDTRSLSDMSYPSTLSAFLSESTFLLMNWMWTGSQLKSMAELNRLVHDVLLAPEFSINDLQGFDAQQATKQVDSMITAHSGIPSKSLPQDVWRETSVKIPVPDNRKHHSPLDPPCPEFKVNSLHYRSVTETIKATWAADSSTPHFKYLPFHQFWKRKPDITEKVYDEVYSSDAFIEVHDAVQNLPSEPGCTPQWSVCALMFWSDSTHLAVFGTSSAWPIYLSFGNQSKYSSAGVAGCHSCHHLAYIPKVS